MSEENINSTISVDQDGNEIDYGKSSSNGVVDTPLDKDGNPIMTMSIDPSGARSYSLDISIPTAEDKESQRKEEIIRDGLKAIREQNSVCYDQIVNENLPEGAIKARTRYAESIRLSQAGPNDIVDIPGFGETDVPIAETLGYIRRNPNTGQYEQVEDSI